MRLAATVLLAVCQSNAPPEPTFCVHFDSFGTEFD
jgi:hypothetical protein